ncbi:MAG: WG repeat-containing protein [Bacillota bacterium]
MDKQPQKRKIPILFFYPLVALAIAAAIAVFALLYGAGGANVLPAEAKGSSSIVEVENSAPTPAPPSRTGRFLPYRNAGLWGYKNSDGETVIEPKYTDAKEFEEDVAFAKDQQIGLYGLIDRSGNWLVEPCWADVSAFCSGRAAVQKDGGSWGYIDAKGKLVVDYLYREAGGYSCGRAKVRTGDRWGYIDTQGDMAIDEEWLECNDFSEDLAFASLRKDGKTTWYIIDKAGMRVATLASNERGTYYSEGFAVIERDGGENYINSKGRTAFSGLYEEAEAFSGGFAAVKMDGLWGYINTGGKFVIDAQYAGARPFSGAMAAVQDQATGLWGYIDRYGVIKIPFRFESAGEFRQKSALVTEDGTVGLIDTNGKFVALY